MGRKFTALWDERELGQFGKCFLLASVVVAVLPNVAYRLNAQLGILLVSILIIFLHDPSKRETVSSGVLLYVS